VPFLLLLFLTIASKKTQPACHLGFDQVVRLKGMATTCPRRGFGRQASRQLPIISPGILKQLQNKMDNNLIPGLEKLQYNYRLVSFKGAIE
jgi:hypothetical protein